MAYQTSTNHYESTLYIVDDSGFSPYSTIQSAIDAANAAGIEATVFIRAGSYTENLTLYDGITLNGYTNLETVLTGVHTPPASGTVKITHLGMASATHILSSAVAGTASIYFENCEFNLTDGFVFNLANWTGNLEIYLCTDVSTVNGIATNSATAPLSIENSVCGVGSTKTLTVNGNLYVDNSNIGCPISVSGSAVVEIVSGSLVEDTLTIADTVDLKITNSQFSTGVNTAISTTSSVTATLSDLSISSTNAAVIDGTGTVLFASVSYDGVHADGASVVVDESGALRTGEIHAQNFERLDMSGFHSWAAAGPYFDDTTLGTFQLLVGGTGYIRGELTTWVAQDYVGMTSGATWYIYIDSTGTIGAATGRTDALFIDNIVLFECLYDETVGTKQQHTVKENHPYAYQVNISNYEHNVIGGVINNTHNGANITLVAPANVKIAISGADIFSDHGLNTTIPDSAGAGVVWERFYTTAGGKWAVQNTTDTFSGYYNNAGTATVLGAGKYGVYRLYVGKDSLNSTTPTYYAVLHTAQFNNSGAADTAIANGTIAVASGELADLELAQLGFIVFDQGDGEISKVDIAKSTLRSTISSGSGSSVASLVTTNTVDFDGILSGADTNVQAALDTIDEWKKSIEVVGTTQSMDANKKYLANNAGTVTLTLPTIISAGSTIEVVGSGSGGWIIAQNANQVIHSVASSSTVGVTGSLSSTSRYDTTRLMCNADNEEFVVVSSMGNITIL